MKPHQSSDYSRPQLQRGEARARLACSGWLLIGFVGASALAAALLRLSAADVQWLPILDLGFSGSVLAVAGWHRARAVLERPERAHDVRAQAQSEVARAAAVR